MCKSVKQLNSVEEGCFVYTALPIIIFIFKKQGWPLYYYTSTDFDYCREIFSVIIVEVLILLHTVENQFHIGGLTFVENL
jgi:hypothetical protein